MRWGPYGVVNRDGGRMGFAGPLWSESSGSGMARSGGGAIANGLKELLPRELLPSALL